MDTVSNKETVYNDLFDYVIENGMVIDPLNRFRTIANVGIRQGKIGIVTRTRLKGNARIIAAGRAA